ncbi:hypothetical protein ENBRE01_0330 [Enteropsectra breve]|nr:hypothetical protein ENBRE01_0330 [Enteropsectra breve]
MRMFNRQVINYFLLSYNVLAIESGEASNFRLSREHVKSLIKIGERVIQKFRPLVTEETPAKKARVEDYNTKENQPIKTKEDNDNGFAMVPGQNEKQSDAVVPQRSNPPTKGQDSNEFVIGKKAISAVARKVNDPGNEVQTVPESTFQQVVTKFNGMLANDEFKLETRGYSVRGLQNGTYACFINAPLLALYYLPNLTDFIIENGHSTAKCPVFQSLYNLFYALFSVKQFDDVEMVNNLLHALNTAKGTDFSRNRANDTDVLIYTLLDTLRDELKELAKETNDSLLETFDSIINPEIYERFRCADGTEKQRASCGRCIFLQNGFNNTMDAIQADFAEIPLDKSDGPSCGVCGKRSAECKIYKTVARPSEYLFVKINRINHDSSYEISEYITVSGYKYKRLGAILFTQPIVPGGIGHFTFQLWKEHEGFIFIDDNIIHDFGMSKSDDDDDYFTSRTSTGIYERV